MTTSGKGRVGRTLCSGETVHTQQVKEKLMVEGGLEGFKWKWLCFRNKKPGKRLQKFVFR